MTDFLLIRHGEPDYSIIDKRNYIGFGNDLAPLSDNGIKQVEYLAKNKEIENADIIISSPHTRTLQTAAILSKELNLDIRVELDLMEWIPDKTYMYDNYSKVVKLREHYEENNGKNVYPEDNFEEKEEIICRVNRVLKKYTSYSKVLVITHGMVINALTSIEKPNCTQIVKYNIS